MKKLTRKKLHDKCGYLRTSDVGLEARYLYVFALLYAIVAERVSWKNEIRFVDNTVV